MINPKCYKCEVELIEYGGILISPPIHNEDDKRFLTIKTHLCTKYYEQTINFLSGINTFSIEKKI